MVITVYDSVKKGSAIVENCTRKEFIEKYGHTYFTTEDLFKTMKEISIWVNNELKEECLFEVG